MFIFINFIVDINFIDVKLFINLKKNSKTFIYNYHGDFVQRAAVSSHKFSFCNLICFFYSLKIFSICCLLSLCKCMDCSSSSINKLIFSCVSISFALSSFWDPFMLVEFIHEIFFTFFRCNGFLGILSIAGL